MMNQIKIGKFIAECRRKKNLTQAQLAEKLNITDRAVSKWETGKSMPDSSIMLELSEILGITVNELLSGEEVDMESYEQKANENLIALGIIFLLAVPFLFSINVILSKMIAEPILDLWDILSVFILLALSFVFFVCDYVRKKRIMK